MDIQQTRTITLSNLRKGLDCDSAVGYHTFQQNDIVYDEDGAVISGSAEALIRRLIPTRDYCPDRSYIFTLLLNIRTFVAPSELLHKVLQHCMFEQNATGVKISQKKVEHVCLLIYSSCAPSGRKICPTIFVMTR
uniref:Ras-GEF domain-containing family member 1A n=1 Tax=Ascaris suum TaxID=6253 RepID=F1LF19_ASCSU